MKCLEELLAWLARFADAFIAHRNRDDMQEPRQRSGTQRGQSGLTPEQPERRAWRNTMLGRLQDAKRIQASVRRNPRSWYELELWEKDALEALESGKLRSRKSKDGTRWTGSGPAISVVTSVIHETEVLQSTLLLDAATMHAVSLMLGDPRANDAPEQF